jgi:hypothetical protein
MNGRLFYVNDDGSRGRGFCSGTSVSTRINQNDLGNRSLVWTAGHCLLYMGVWRGRIMFIPGYRYYNGTHYAPHGMWRARTDGLWATKWRQSGENFSYDFGAILVKTKVIQGRTRRLNDYAGAAAIQFRQVPEYIYEHGYPAAGTRDNPNWNGNALWQCALPFKRFTDEPGTHPNQLVTGCNLWTGASGGGMFFPWDNSLGGTVKSVLSRGQRGDDGAPPDIIENLGTYLGNDAESLYRNVRTR